MGSKGDRRRFWGQKRVKDEEGQRAAASVQGQASSLSGSAGSHRAQQRGAWERCQRERPKALRGLSADRRVRTKEMPLQGPGS